MRLGAVSDFLVDVFFGDLQTGFFKLGSDQVFVDNALEGRITEATHALVGDLLASDVLAVDDCQSLDLASLGLDGGASSRLLSHQRSGGKGQANECRQCKRRGKN